MASTGDPPVAPSKEKAMFALKSLALSLLLLAGQVFAAGGPVDLNSADAATLATLNGIGPAKAEAIVAYRKEHGPFQTAEQLAQV